MKYILYFLGVFAYSLSFSLVHFNTRVNDENFGNNIVRIDNVTSDNDVLNRLCGFGHSLQETYGILTDNQNIRVREVSLDQSTENFVTILAGWHNENSQDNELHFTIYLKTLNNDAIKCHVYRNRPAICGERDITDKIKKDANKQGKIVLARRGENFKSTK